MKELFDLVYICRESIIRQAVEENLAVTLLRNSIIQQDENAAVGAAANQPAKSLFQGERGLGDLVVVKRIPTRFTYVLDASLNHWVARNRERQLIDDHTAQLLALNVNALPEGRGGEQDA